MSNTTDVYWEASGISLQTEAWGISTWGGGRNAVPGSRGEDYMVPFRHGRSTVRKYKDARVIPLAMWMIPRNPDGTKDSSMSEAAKRDANWEYLMGLFDVEGQFPLKKRWYDDGVVRSATAQAELLEPPEPTVAGGRRLEFTVQAMLADPWFYDAAVSEPVGTITVQGNAPTDHVTLTMGNGRVTLPDGNWIEYTGTGTVVVDCHAGTAKQGSTYVNGLISRNPKFPDWPRLRPGVNALTGTGTVSYEPAYK